MKILVTGGAGYIGSHMVRTLGEKGHDVVVLDNLSTGHRDAVLYGRFVKGDLSNRRVLMRLVEAEKFDAAMHFAAHIVVEESVSAPVKYYRNNFANALNLIDACATYGVSRFIFSSTAAVYGIPDHVPVDETAPIRPINPYGASKAMVEQLLEDVARISNLRYITLRYFNVAGADHLARLGQRYRKPTHLITLALKTAMGLRKSLAIFGTDYETPDGTCIRDYIHIDDLIDAHLMSLEHLASGGSSKTYNCGCGRGYSVREVVNVARKVTGVDFIVNETSRRPGDPPSLICDPSLIKKELGWMPRHADLDYIVQTAWNWEKEYSLLVKG